MSPAVASDRSAVEGLEFTSYNVLTGGIAGKLWIALEYSRQRPMNKEVRLVHILSVAFCRRPKPLRKSDCACAYTIHVRPPKGAVGAS